MPCISCEINDETKSFIILLKIKNDNNYNSNLLDYVEDFVPQRSDY